MTFLKLLQVASKAKVVTRRYPFAKPLITEEFRGMIRVDPSKCWGCGVCTRICPPNALTLNLKDAGTLSLTYFAGRCIFCGMCAEVCPMNAIQVTKEFELASLSMEDLSASVLHDVLKCDVCGTTIGPKIEIYKAVSSVKDFSKYVSLCPTCRRVATIKRIATKMGVRYGE